MPMVNQQGTNWGIVCGQLSQVLKALRGALQDADAVVGWVNKQAAADLVTIGGPEAEVTEVQTVCGQLATYFATASGGPPPTEAVDYIDQAIDLIGPYA